MKVFISWSGPLSRQIADALREWLPMAIQAVKPYMSDRDNEAGVRWEGVVSAELNASDFGLICLTPDNLKSTWLNFEAGALGKAVDRARVVPLLYKLTPSDVAPPLSMFMAKPLDGEGVRETLVAINKGLDDDRRLEPAALDGAFKAMWPTLEEKLSIIEAQDASSEPEPRKDREILQEMLLLVRGLTVRNTNIQRLIASTPAAYGPPPMPAGLVRPIIDYDIFQRVADIFGHDVTVEVKGDRLIVRGVPSNADLGPENQRKYEQLDTELKSQGVDLVFRPRFDDGADY